MIAIDTNVVVRLLVNDDVAQARRARALVTGGVDVFVAPTVLLECEWVLRAAYNFAPPQIGGFLRALLGLPGLHTEQPERVAQALDAYGRGMDFADALHLSFSHTAERFYTFDAQFRRNAARSASVPGVWAP